MDEVVMGKLWIELCGFRVLVPLQHHNPSRSPLYASDQGRAEAELFRKLYMKHMAHGRPSKHIRALLSRLPFALGSGQLRF